MRPSELYDGKSGERAFLLWNCHLGLKIDLCFIFADALHG